MGEHQGLGMPGGGGDDLKIRVLIAEDNESIRKWYQVSLQEAEDIDLLPMAMKLSRWRQGITPIW